MVRNITIDTDSYKVSHHRQYPFPTDYLSFYMEARRMPEKWTTGGLNGTTPMPLIMYGYNHILRILEHQTTMDEVMFADEYWRSQNMPFYLEGWKRLVEKHDGRLPLRITAVPEGTKVPHLNVVMQMMNTDPEFFWLPGWCETKLMRTWYPTTVCTLSGMLRDKILDCLMKTSDDPMAELPYKLNDFGSRGATSGESAEIGGSAHLVNFKGSDTGVAMLHAMENYGATMGIAMSIPAAEHSTMTSWGKHGETDAYSNMLDEFGHSLYANVGDSYDLWNAIDNIWGGTLKERIINMPGMLVVRPDSGDPCYVVLETLKRLDKAFGHVINSKGYKVLNHVRVIQGDGVNEESILAILKIVMGAKYSITNLAFGMGGGLHQQVNRDTLGFAMKCSARNVNGQWYDVYKEPKTDMFKVSKKGRQALLKHHNGGWETRRMDEMPDLRANQLIDVFRDGKIVNQPKWDEIVERACA